MSHISINLNKEQNIAFNKINDFIKSDNQYKFLLLGYAGTGKTFTIVNSINFIQNEIKNIIKDTINKNIIKNTNEDTNKDLNEIKNTNKDTNNTINENLNNTQINKLINVVFCSFTNKATQVLRKMSNKIKINFQCEFKTIHRLLELDIKYLDNELEIGFKFDVNKTESMKDLDIVIIDECSTINKELYDYLIKAVEFIKFKYHKQIKLIFLGDMYQLPPIGEKISCIFTNVKIEKWPFAILTEVMRYINTTIKNINNDLHTWIDIFKNPNDEDYKEHLDTFIQYYPNNLLSRTEYPKIYINSLGEFYNKFVELCYDKKESDSVIITYSKVNCDKINNNIQDILDSRCKRPIEEIRSDIKFYINDRCCVDKLFEVYNVGKFFSSELGDIYELTNTTEEFLYNGEIFDIVDAKDIKIRSSLNKFEYINKYFDGQLLTIKQIDNKNTKTYNVIHIYQSQIDTARKQLRMHNRREFYLEIMSNFIKIYPKLVYGYCITLYKSQGSEYNNVFINLNSIKFSIVNTNQDDKNKNYKYKDREKLTDFEIKKQLFKSTYTSVTRTTNNVNLFWF